MNGEKLYAYGSRHETAPVCPRPASVSYCFTLCILPEVQQEVLYRLSDEVRC
jgi:hypothetical protein